MLSPVDRLVANSQLRITNLGGPVGERSSVLKVAADAYFCQAWDECNGIDPDSLTVTGNKVASFDIVNTSDYPESSCILPTAGTIRVVDCNE